MPTEMQCPSCSRSLQLPDELRNQTVRCPTCGETFKAALQRPAKPAAAPPPIPPQGVASYPAQPLVPYQSESARGYRDDDEDDYRRSRYDDDDEYAFRRSRRSRHVSDKPGNVQAVAVLMLIGGIVSVIAAAVYIVAAGVPSFGICCIWPGWIFAIVSGILAIVKGSQLLGEQGYRHAPPTAQGVMLIINIVNFDIVSCVMGIIILVLLSDPETKDYFQG